MTACHYCGDRDGPFERDHVRPQARGGTDHNDNLVTACRACNRAKSDRTPTEWLGAPCCDTHSAIWCEALLATRHAATRTPDHDSRSSGAGRPARHTDDLPWLGSTPAEERLRARTAALRTCAGGMLTDRPFAPGTTTCTDCARAHNDPGSHRATEHTADNPTDGSWRGTVWVRCACGWSSGPYPRSRDNADHAHRLHARHRRTATCEARRP